MKTVKLALLTLVFTSCGIVTESPTPSCDTTKTITTVLDSVKTDTIKPIGKPLPVVIDTTKFKSK